MKKIMFLLIFGSAMIGCKTMQPGNKGQVELSGKIQQQGMTSYQYGSHLLIKKDKTYALKSASINLDSYLNSEVTIRGGKVEGYPVENGPELIEVSEVIIKKQ